MVAFLRAATAAIGKVFLMMMLSTVKMVSSLLGITVPDEGGCTKARLSLGSKVRLPPNKAET